jgi:hypothetical protein
MYASQLHENFVGGGRRPLHTEGYELPGERDLPFFFFGVDGVYVLGDVVAEVSVEDGLEVFLNGGEEEKQEAERHK